MRPSHEFYPKEALAAFSGKGRALVEIGVKAHLLPEPGILATIATIIARAGARILSLNFTARDNVRYILLFADFSEAKKPVKEVVDEIKRQPFAMEVRFHAKTIGSLIIDKYGFPVSTAQGALRLLMIPAEIFAKVFLSFREKLGPAGAAISYHEGFEMGSKMIEFYVRVIKLSPREAFLVLLEIYRALGLGIPELVRIDLEKPFIRVRIRENFEAEGLSADTPVCHFTRGLLAGALHYVKRVEVKVEEVKCRATGEEYCEFVISPV